MYETRETKRGFSRSHASRYDQRLNLGEVAHGRFAVSFFSADALTDGFSCPTGDVVGPNGRILPHPTFAHPDDCQKFYICRNGVTPQYGSCSAGSVYNEVSFKCDDPDNVPGW